jgi:tryptophanyl-tRNA synthetase
MSRILTGIQATGTPHLGNLLGAIIPAIELSQKKENESFLFIANLHSLTQIKSAAELKQNFIQKNYKPRLVLTLAKVSFAIFFVFSAPSCSFISNSSR